MLTIVSQALCFITLNIFILVLISILCQNIGIIVIGIVGVMITTICARGLNKNTYAYMTILMLVMFLFLFFHYNMLIEKYGIPYYAGDDEQFEVWGHALYKKGYFLHADLENFVFTNQGNARGYPLLLARIELLAGGTYHTLMPRILNLYLWLSTSLLTLKIFRLKMRNSKIEKFILFSLALFPNGIYISSFVYRDTALEFLIIVAIYNAFLIFNISHINYEHNLFSKMFILISLFYIYYMRKMMIPVCVLMGIVIYLDAHKVDYKNRKILSYIIVGSILFIGIAVSDIGIQIWHYSTKYQQYILSQKYGFSSSIFRMPILPYGWIVRILYGMTSPFPGTLLSLNFVDYPLYSTMEAIISIGTIFQIFLLPYVFRGIANKNCYALLYIVMMLVICLTTFTFRHFIMPLPFLALTAAEMYINTKNTIHQKYFIEIGMLLIILCVIYILMR